MWEKSLWRNLHFNFIPWSISKMHSSPKRSGDDQDESYARPSWCGKPKCGMSNNPTRMLTKIAKEVKHPMHIVHWIIVRHENWPKIAGGFPQISTWHLFRKKTSGVLFLFPISGWHHFKGFTPPLLPEKPQRLQHNQVLPRKFFLIHFHSYFFFH